MLDIERRIGPARVQAGRAIEAQRARAKRKQRERVKALRLRRRTKRAVVVA